MSRTAVAVIVVCHNHGRTLDEALSSVTYQTAQPDEIVILDLDSDDIYTQQALARMERGGTCVVRAHDLTAGAARNLAVRSTASSHLVVLEGNCALPADYLEHASAFLNEHRDVAFVTPPIRATKTGPSLQPLSLVETLAQDAVHPAAMFCRRAWAAVNGFDERCRGHHALDFWTSLIERGLIGRALPVACEIRRLGPRRRETPGGQQAVLMDELFHRHAGAVNDHAIELLLAKEERLLQEREQHQAIHDRSTALHEELGSLNRQIEEVLHQLGAVGRARVDLGDLRRTSPISPHWGLDRGLPLDRHYIEAFLDRHRLDIRGRVLEVKDPGYTRMFGDDRVRVSDVIDVDIENPLANIVADLTKADEIAGDAYDCFVLTQTLGVIYDVRAALANAYRLLKPGGVLLCTLPAAGRISYEGPALDGDYWRFTEASIRRLFGEVFPVDAFEVSGFGNVLAGAAFLYGLAPHELTRDELEFTDPFFPIVYGVRAVKPPQRVSLGGARHPSSTWGAILMYHRVAPGEPSTASLSVTPEHFASHLRWLSDHAIHVVALDALAESIRRQDLRVPTVALTFDDGYVEALPLARGILRDLALPATFFVVGRTLEDGEEFWWDALSRVFDCGHALPSRLVVRVADEAVDVPTMSAFDRAVARSLLRSAFFKLGRRDRDRLLAALLEWSGLGPRRDAIARPLTPAEILELAALPYVDIGAHSENHLWLPSQPRHSQAAEITGSKARLEALLGNPITAFSYPYGGHDATSAELVRRAGFRVAVTTERRPVIPGDDPLRLPRIEVENWDRDEFEARVGRLLPIAESTGKVVAGATPHRAESLAD